MDWQNVYYSIHFENGENNQFQHNLKKKIHQKKYHACTSEIEYFICISGVYYSKMCLFTY